MQFVLVLLLAVSPTVQSLNVLGLFLHPSLSHFKFFHPIMRGLADAGHEVTVVSHFPDKDAPKNYKDLPLTKTELRTNAVDLGIYSYRQWYQLFQEFFMLFQRGIHACELAFNSTALQTILNSKQKYDIVLLEQFNNDCMMAIAWKLKAPIIGMSSNLLWPWHYDRLGTPFIPSYMPVLFAKSSEKMCFFERLSNWIIFNGMNLLYRYITTPETDKIIQKYMKDESIPSITDLVKEISLMFLNTHYSLTGSKPYASTIVELGGVHIKEEKPLDLELKSFLDSAEYGVIYVSWGSKIRASTLTDDKLYCLLNVFASLKQKVVWKFENDTIKDKPEHILIRKWMPQKDILCHPNVRVFVSHGGLMGSSEAAYCSVPIVFTPFFGDQFHNAAAIKARGMGFIVHYESITEETFKTAIDKALKPQAMESAKAVSYSFRNRLQNPVDTAVWWVEYVSATQGAPFLKSHSVNLTPFTYYSFDIYITIAVVSITITTVLFYISRKIYTEIYKRIKKLKTD